MTPADDRVADRDPSIRGLRTVLNPAALREWVSDLPLEGLEATYVRYKPGTSCLVAYEARIEGRETHFYARAQAEDAADKLPRESVGDPRGDPRRWSLPLPELNMALIGWGADRRLRALDRLADDDARPRLLERLLPEQPQLWRADISLIRYKPERRLVARVDGDNGPAAALKAHAGAAWRQAARAAKDIRSQPPLRVAKRLGRSPRRRVVALEWVAGEHLDEVLESRDPAVEELSRVGEAIAALHSQPSRKLPRAGAREARAVQAAAAAVATLCPELEADVNEVAAEVASAVGAAAESGPIHGDFTPDQVRLSPDAVVLLDLDRASVGDSASDFATFEAALELAVVRGRVPRARADAALAGLYDGYKHAADRAAPPRPHLVAAALIKLGPLPFRERAPQWPAETACLVRRARESLDRA